jgi:hypothetical protein
MSAPGNKTFLPLILIKFLEKRSMMSAVMIRSHKHTKEQQQKRNLWPLTRRVKLFGWEREYLSSCKYILQIVLLFLNVIVRSRLGGKVLSVSTRALGSIQDSGFFPFYFLSLSASHWVISEVGGC